MPNVRAAAEAVLNRHLPPRAVASVLETLTDTGEKAVGTLDLVTCSEVMFRLDTGLQTFGCADPKTARSQLRQSITGGKTPSPVSQRVAIRSDADLLAVRRQCQTMARHFFGATDCVRLATAASELARNIYLYAKQGEIELRVVEEQGGFRFSIEARDQGPGIPHLDSVLSGAYVSKTGLGRGLLGTRNLLDEFSVETAVGKGTVVRGSKKAAPRR